MDYILYFNQEMRVHVNLYFSVISLLEIRIKRIAI